MLRKEFLIANASGLHTRPGNDFVKTAKQFGCDITLTKGEKTVDGKSLLKIMKANVIKGDTVVLCCSGGDEAAAMNALEAFLSSLAD
jgi:phosphotransferase system HPr (HPr) family protein